MDGGTRRRLTVSTEAVAYMKISVVSPIWKRPLLTLHYLNQLRRWKSYFHKHYPSVQLGAVIIGSEGERTRRMAEGFVYVEHFNQPLSDKFNSGIRKALEIGADYVLIMGSDQFADLTLDTYVWEPSTGRALYWPGYTDKRIGKPVGPGRFIHRSLLEPLNGELYAPGLKNNLDGTADERLPEPVTFRAKMHRFVSVKTEESITGADRYLGDPADPAMFYELLR
jgi:hypothetical protein